MGCTPVSLHIPHLLSVSRVPIFSQCHEFSCDELGDSNFSSFLRTTLVSVIIGAGTSLRKALSESTHSKAWKLRYYRVLCCADFEVDYCVTVFHVVIKFLVIISGQKSTTTAYIYTFIIYIHILILSAQLLHLLLHLTAPGVLYYFYVDPILLLGNQTAHSVNLSLTELYLLTKKKRNNK